MPETPKSPETAAFIANVMRLAKVGNPTELAGRLGWTTPSLIRKVYKWAAGESSPNGPSTMALLKVAGLLTAPRGEAEVGVGDPNRRLLGELETAVGTMVTTQQRLLDDLADVRTRLQRLEAVRPAASGRKRKAG